MDSKKLKIYILSFIFLAVVSLLLTSVSIPSIIGSQIGVNPFRVLKIIALLSLVSAMITYFKFLKINKVDNI
ncbi:hypothetical protein [Bacillus pseudomycoides]|uniref:hypothetical protein n=1 Tax=Bacillus pseudomycoides TaxID=64104 RepID=UPI000BF8DA76|nr:hypothetical protein [Bacillus pseudomycoides]MBD5798874.1 hypothetical protein [Bacillus pseudomycoides]MED1473974.1 hypothetical protein [Bacillus pseudomycoides]PEO79007.1 hypothetical protein CN571_28660 [Bacillus pseudomycoides]PGE00992.1 hypothetical protein COM49_19665 [Bacillus pseudomycoides]PHG15709.1 hypothetical protein COI47_26445 [Bacillus pseudomycoides]